LSAATPLARIAVGIVVDRTKAVSRWADFIWRPVQALAGVPETAPWTVLSQDQETTRFYAGAVEIELYRSETDHYRDNLASGAPMLWVALRPATGETGNADAPPFAIAAVTADPAEGEGFTEAGAALVESVPMPRPIEDALAQFIAEHHVDREFVKRKRDRADPEALARRSRQAGEGE
jgi:hypothetical protein